jgi:phosphohistidine swiveling domain-containing protein
MASGPRPVVDLSDGLAQDHTLYGGKARGLFALTANGQFNVPPGLAVLPWATVEECRSLWQEMDWQGSWIVRSSALAEDSADASFAGLFISIGNLKAEQIWRAVEQCRVSSKSERVRIYQESRGLPLDDSPIPVIIQQEIKAQVSGVAFTLNPTTGKDFEILIEACRGHGEKLVSGLVTPYQWVLDRRDWSLLSSRPGQADQTAPLSKEELLTLLQMLLDVQAHFGSPQDIEWVFDGQNFLLVQSRPITSIRERMDMGEWTTADFRDGGVSSSVCSPFMYSLYEDAVEHSMTAYFRCIQLLAAKPKWMTYQYGRVYWNLGGVKECLKRVPGYSEEEFDRDLGIEKDYGNAGPWTTETSLSTILPVIPTAIMLEAEFVAQRLRVAQFIKGFSKRKERVLAFYAGARECAEQAAWGLEKSISQLHGPTERCYFRTIYNSTNLQGEFKKYLQGLGRSLSPAPAHLTLVTGLGEIAHFEAERELHKLYTCPDHEVPAKLAEFLRAHGHRGTRELDITVPRWREDPSFIEDQIARMRALEDALPRAPDLLLNAQRENFNREYDRVVTDLPFPQSSVFKLRLAQARDYLIVRERMRDCSTQAYAVVRLFALELGQRLCHLKILESPSQIFLLTFQEALEWGRKPGAIRGAASLLRARQSDMDGFRDFKAPHEFGIGAKPKDNTAGSGALRGIGCSPGQVEAPAFVAHTVDEAAKAPAGSVLIAPFTDPGWTPVFSRLAAVVTEAGGLLSHAAVLSREYGIPAVLAVDGALKAIQSGELVRVDGDHGYVERVEAVESE